jgi:hypothetical protein
MKMRNDWAQLDESECPCEGKGWGQVDLNEWRECPIHFVGQLHPETCSLLLDEPNRLDEEKRRALLRYEIRAGQAAVRELQKQIKVEQDRLLKLELELVNKTPTVRAMAAVTADPKVEVVDEITLLEGDFI